MKYIFPILIIFLLALSSSCTNAPKKSKIAPNEKSFIPPVLVDFPQNGETIDTVRQLESMTYPLLISSSDSLHFKGFNRIRQAYFSRDSIPYSQSGNLQLFVDVNQSFAGKYYEQTPWSAILIQIDENGNEIQKAPYRPPYESVTQFPVFIINDSDSLQALENHDGKMVFIQEALTKDGKWKAIEYFEYSGCGNSVGLNFIQPNERLLFGVNKYAGNFKTKLRIRLRTNGKILFSNEYSGFINEDQFKETETNSTFGMYRYLNEF